jgi:hypothetical protein
MHGEHDLNHDVKYVLNLTCRISCSSLALLFPTNWKPPRLKMANDDDHELQPEADTLNRSAVEQTSAQRKQNMAKVHDLIQEIQNRASPRTRQETRQTRWNTDGNLTVIYRRVTAY